MSREPVRILQVVGYMGRGGTETVLMRVLRHIDRSEFQFDFCTCWPRPGDFDQEVEQLGGRVLPCDLMGNLLTFPKRFRGIVREGRYDAVHAHIDWYCGSIVREAQRAGVRMRIAHMHSISEGGKQKIKRRVHRWLMKRWVDQWATHGLAVSALAAAALFGPDWRADPRVRVLHHSIDLEAFRQPVDRQAVRQELGIPEGAPVLGHVGRFGPEKNHEFILKVAVEAAKRCPELRVLLVGDGELRCEIEARAQALGLDRRVIFTGVRPDVPRLMLGAMDAVILPSLWEGLGGVLIEAQAAGLRSLASAAVPRETTVVPGAIEYAPFSEGPGQWANRLFRILAQGRLDQGEAMDAMEHSDFTVEYAGKFLPELYRHAVL